MSTGRRGTTTALATEVADAEPAAFEAVTTDANV
jgi:hypothetical protein